jgi:hypothetical protein
MAMKKLFLLPLAALLIAPVTAAAPAADGDLTKPIRQFIDGFNTGDTKSAYAAYVQGDVSIIDEFAPHLWVGPKAPQLWAADYDKHAKATKVTDGSVKYGPPTRSEVEGARAYVIIPTVYNYKEKGARIAEEGEMTFVLSKGKLGWKIKAWTWSGVKPHPAG